MIDLLHNLALGFGVALSPMNLFLCLIGALVGTIVGFLILTNLPEIRAWRWMYATALVPALAVTIARFFIVESANWLAVRGAYDRAEQSVTRLLVRRPQYPNNIQLSRGSGNEGGEGHGNQSFMALFNQRNRRATIFASVPWFLQDLGTYGIGIFTPTILAAALGGPADHIRSLSDLIADAILAAKGAALITILLIVGILFAVMLADTFGRIKLQVFGFIGCAVGLLIASFSMDFTGTTQIDVIDERTVKARSYYYVLTPHGLDHWGRYLDEYGLVGKIPGQAIRRVDIEAIEVAGGRQVTQPLQGRPQQRGAAVAVVQETPLRRHRAAVGLGPLYEGGHLAGDAAVLAARTRGHPAIQAGTHAR